ncbi:GTP pyrophosphokinase [Parafannyhessea umbonata]|uniref:GTP pyrophosphokinase n=1 Tax=Parafannyhessea umbonata TaxID=604330 RepID=UPI003F9ABA96
MGPQETIAQAIARKAHAGQTDKAGAPYIEHPAHVAAQVSGDKAKATAWLHDVVEDTPTTFDDLRAAGVEDDVIDALELLTHDKSVPYLDYVSNLKHNALARTVKLADLTHNSDLSRLTKVTDADRERVQKYRLAIALLRSQ